MSLRRRMILVRLLAVAALVAALAVAFTRPAEAWTYVASDPAACLRYAGSYDAQCTIRQDAREFRMMHNLMWNGAVRQSPMVAMQEFLRELLDYPMVDSRGALREFYKDRLGIHWNEESIHFRFQQPWE